MRTFVSISSCCYLIAQNSKIGERQTETFDSPNAPSRPSLPQRPDSTHSSLKVPNWTSSVYPHISAATHFRPPEPGQRFPTDLFQSRKDPTSGPQSFRKPSLDQRHGISKHQKGHSQHQLFKSNGLEKRYRSFTTLSTIHPSPSVQTSSPIHQHTTHHTPSQIQNNPTISASMLQYRRAVPNQL